MKFLRYHRPFFSLWLVFALQLLPATLNAQSREYISNPAEKTRSALAEEEWSEAYLAARDWVDVEPDNPTALASMASIYLQLGASAAAIEFAREGLVKTPTEDLRGQLLLVQALAHADAGEFAVAWNVYDQILRELPSESPAHVLAKRARWSVWAQNLERPARDLMLARVTAAGVGNAGAEKRYFLALFALDEEVGLQGLRDEFSSGGVSAESLELGVAIALRVGWVTIDEDRAAGVALVEETARWLSAMENAGFDPIALGDYQLALGRLIRKLEPDDADLSGASPDEYGAESEEASEDPQAAGEADKDSFKTEIKSAEEQLQVASERAQVAQDFLADLEAWSKAGELPMSAPGISTLRQQYLSMCEGLSSLLQDLEEIAYGLEASRTQVGSMMQMDMSGQWTETYESLSKAMRRCASLNLDVGELVNSGNAPWVRFHSGLARGARIAALHSATTPEEVLLASDMIWLLGDRYAAHWALRGEALVGLESEEEASYALARYRMELELAGDENQSPVSTVSGQLLETRLESAARIAQEVGVVLDRGNFEVAGSMLKDALDHNPIGSQVLYQAWRYSLATEHPMLAAAALRRYWLAGGSAGDELLDFMVSACNGGDWELLGSITNDGMVLEVESPDVWYYRMLAALALGQDSRFERCAEVLKSSRYHDLVPAARLAAQLSLRSAPGELEPWVESVARTAGESIGEAPWAAWKGALVEVTKSAGEPDLGSLRKASLDPRIPAVARAAVHRLSLQQLAASGPTQTTLPLRAQDAYLLPRGAVCSAELLSQLAPGQQILFGGRLDLGMMNQDSILRLRGVSPDSQVSWAGSSARSKISLKASLVELEGLAIDTAGASLYVADNSVLHLTRVRTGEGELEVKGTVRFSGGQVGRSLIAQIGARLRMRDVLLTGPRWKIAGEVEIHSSHYTAAEPQVVVYGKGRLVLDDVTVASRRGVGRDGVALTIKNSGRLRLQHSTLVGLREGDLRLQGKGVLLKARNSTSFGSPQLVHQDASYTWDGEGLGLQVAPLPGAKVSDIAYDETGLRTKLAAAKPGELVGLSMRECVLSGGPLVIPEGAGIKGMHDAEGGVKIVIGGRITQAIVGEPGGATFVSGCNFIVENKRTAMTSGLELLVMDETPRVLLTKDSGLLVLNDCWVGGARSDGPYTSIDLGAQAILLGDHLVVQRPVGQTLRMGKGAQAYLASLGGASFVSKGPGRIFASQIDGGPLEVWGAGAVCNAPRSRVVFKQGAGDAADLELRRISIARSFRDQGWAELRETFLEKAPTLSVIECAELSRDLSEEFVAIAQRAQTPVEETKAYFSDFIYPYLEEHPKQAGAILMKVSSDAFEYADLHERLSPDLRSEIKAFANVVLMLGPRANLARNVESFEYLKAFPPGSSGYGNAMRAFRSGLSVSGYRHQLASQPVVTGDSFSGQRQADVIARMESFWAKKNAALHSFGHSGSSSSWAPSFKVKAWSGSANAWTPSADARASQYRRDLNTQIRRATGGTR